jgi:leucyl-tRNA synthetase
VIFQQGWPVADAELARESEMEIPVQVNGKLVTVVTLAAESDEEQLKAAALGDEKVVTRLAGKTLVKTIVIKGKLVNLVAK